MNPAVEAQVNCLVCAMNAYCICQIANSNHLAILHYSASTRFFQLGTCYSAFKMKAINMHIVTL